MSTVDHDPEAFAEELSALKRRGCAILVVNPPSGRERCEALMGEDDRGRQRVVVDTGSDTRVAAGDVIDAGTPGIRSASAETQVTGTGSVRDLDSIRDELHDRIDTLAEAGLEPGELRVCLGDAETLAAREEEGIERFLRDAAARIREESGMGHVHVPVTSPVRDWIEPIVDITVEVRSTPEGGQQRWLLHESGLDSGWLAIEDGSGV